MDRKTSRSCRRVAIGTPHWLQGRMRAMASLGKRRWENRFRHTFCSETRTGKARQRRCSSERIQEVKDVEMYWLGVVSDLQVCDIQGDNADVVRKIQVASNAIRW